MGNFSARPNISLNLIVTGITPEAGNNRSYVTFYLEVRENISQPSFNYDPVGTGSVSFSWNGGSTSFTVPGWNFDFQASGLQAKTIYSNAFYATHASDGAGGTLSGSAAAAISPLGSATATSSNGLENFDRSPTWADSSVNGTATRGTYYSDGVSANAASSYGIVSNRLPYGLSLNTSNGAITGTPTTVESQSFTIRAYGTYEGAIDTPLSINVRPALPVFSDGSVNSSARVGIAYSDGVTASEAASYSVVAAPNTLPPGLTLNTSTGAITGTPTTPGTYSFKIRATNVTGSTDTATLTITAISAARVWNGTAFVSGLANVWNGTAFVSGIIKVWDGTTWKNTN